jgi:hypothetical protein
LKYLAFIAVVALCLTTGANAQAVYGAGGPYETHITTHNETDMAVWITAYSPRLGGGKIEGAWSVAPHSEDSHGLRTLVTDVRAEINAGACSGTNRLDSQLGSHYETKRGDASIYRLVGYVRHINGKCTWTT